MVPGSDWSRKGPGSAKVSLSSRVVMLAVIYAAVYTPDILNPFPPILPETSEGKCDHPFVTGEEFQAQRACLSLQPSQVAVMSPLPTFMLIWCHNDSQS